MHRTISTDTEKSESDAFEVDAPDWEAHRGIQALNFTENDRTMMECLKDSPQERVHIVMKNDPSSYARLFCHIVSVVNQDQTLLYMVNIIDQLFSKSEEFITIFQALPMDVVTPFLRLLGKSDMFILERTYRILSSLLDLFETPHINALELFINAIQGQLEQPDGAAMAVHALMIVLRRSPHRPIFYRSRGIPILVPILRGAVTANNIQLTYEICVCIWLLSYESEITHILDEVRIVPVLHDVIRHISKEKVIRVILATYKNLLSYQQYISAMINVGVPKTLANLAKKKFADEDITELVQTLSEKLEQNINELSSFNEYRQEVLSGHLEWTPPHTSEKFWRENMTQFEANNFYILRELAKQVQGDDAQNLAICCHDLGQFVQFHPRGKKIIEELNIKMRIMSLMEHEDDTVKKHALLCTQKLMVRNWEFLQRLR